MRRTSGGIRPLPWQCHHARNILRQFGGAHEAVMPAWRFGKGCTGPVHQVSPCRISKAITCAKGDSDCFRLHPNKAQRGERVTKADEQQRVGHSHVLKHSCVLLLAGELGIVRRAQHNRSRVLGVPMTAVPVSIDVKHLSLAILWSNPISHRSFLSAEVLQGQRLGATFSGPSIYSCTLFHVTVSQPHHRRTGHQHVLGAHCTYAFTECTGVVFDEIVKVRGHHGDIQSTKRVQQSRILHQGHA